jgi:hypothetical protein
VPAVRVVAERLQQPDERVDLAVDVADHVEAAIEQRRELGDGWIGRVHAAPVCSIGKPSGCATLRDRETHMTDLLRKSTPVLIVERIEPVLEFWQRVGVMKVMDVPEGEGGAARLGFAILAGAGLEVMYQTVTSVQADLVASAGVRDAFRTTPQQGYLFVEVAGIRELEQRMQGERLLMPYRETFYGAKELAYDDRAGNVVIFAEMPAA